MAQEKEQYLAERTEYHIRVPKVPRQSVDVFARNVEGGNYGLSAEKVDTIQSYITLQQTISSFEDITFSPDFLDKLPEDFRKKIGENLYPGIALADLEIPTTDKVLLAQMLAADRLTETLSQAPVEVWVSDAIQKELKELGSPIETGLQQVDYSQLSIKIKLYLVKLMEHQEVQVHTILAARQRFPQGVPPLGLFPLFSGKKERTMFDSLSDLDEQYRVARQAMDNPLLLHFAESIAKGRDEKKSEKNLEAEEAKPKQPDDFEDRFPVQVEEAAKREWWDFDKCYYKFETMEKIAAYLRPQFADKTIYEILGAETVEAQHDALAAFWRTGGERIIDLGDESWVRNNLYLKPDGTLELHYQDSVYDEGDVSTITGSPEHYRDVAMVDQTIKWIKEEMAEMQEVREQWEKSGLSQSQLIEVSLAATLNIDGDSEVMEEVDGLPKWFQTALVQEMRYYNQLSTYTPKFEITDLFSLMPTESGSRQNMLKSYFDLSNARLERDRRLISNPEELYKDLDLESSASTEEVKKAYRKIAKETKAIQISSPEEFDSEEWKLMNARFTRAARAYSALSHRKLGEARVTTLGRLSTYFQMN